MGTARLLTLTWKLQGGVPRGPQWFLAPSEPRKVAWNLHQKVSLRHEQKLKTGDVQALVLLPRPCLQKDIAPDPSFREVMEKEIQ